MWLGWEFWHGKEEGRLQNPLPTPRSASCLSLFSAAYPVPEADALLRKAEVTCKALLSSFLLKKKNKLLTGCREKLKNVNSPGSKKKQTQRAYKANLREAQALHLF